MKIIEALSFLLVFSFCFILFDETGFCTNVQMVRTRTNDEIDLEIRQQIAKIKNELFISIKKKDYEKLSKLLSPKLLKLQKFNIESFVIQVSQFMDRNEFIILDQYFSTINAFGKPFQATVIPSLTDKHKFIINNLTFLGKESYNLFLKSTTPGWQYLMFLSFSKINDEWKINSMHVGNYSISNLTAPKLVKMGKEAMSKGRLTSCFVYSWAINKTLRPAPYLQYMDEKKYVEFVKVSHSTFNKKIKFPFIIAGKKFIGLQIETTKFEGLIPIIMYITEKHLKGPVVDSEAKQIKDEMLNKFYGIDHDFDYILMRAYRELPTDSKKLYKTHNTIIKMRKK
ncbi:hypothetical protein ACFL4N_02070 [Thermodesulfobacteriota bacterium]